MIEVKISNSSLGTIRKVKFEGISNMFFSLKTAEIEWLVFQFDQEGNLIESPDIKQGRSVISPISNQNQVNPQTGITLLDGQEGGFPEFDWWWNVLQSQPLPIVLTQAIQILDSQGRFDRP
jgi:hypothetical protein